MKWHELVWYLFIISVGMYLYIDMLEEKMDIHVLEKQQPLKCTSPFDIYVTFHYDEGNETILTSSGRVYRVEDCEVYEN